MATTTTTRGTAPASPTRRHRVFTHNTSYTGAAGVHSEVSKKSQALQLTSQKHLNSNMSTLTNIHQKELRSLNQHRKSLETSMLAYSEKMRRISADRIMLAETFSSASDPSTAASAGKKISTTAWERLLALKQTARSSASFSGQNQNYKKKSRVSVDSGIDVDDTVSDIEEDRKMSDRRSIPSKDVCIDPRYRKQSSGSLFLLDSDLSLIHNVVLYDTTDELLSNGTNGVPAIAPERQRRPGTTEKPDVLAFKLSSRARNEDSNTNIHKDSSSSSLTSLSSPVVAAAKTEEYADARLAITPFPEVKRSSPPSSSYSAVRVDQNGVLIEPEEDQERAQGASSRTSQASKKKFMKARETSCILKKGHPRRGTPPASTQKTYQSPRKNGTQVGAHSSTPRKSAAKPTPKTQNKPPGEPTKKSFQHSFRYSNAVEDVIKSFDDPQETKAIEHKTIVASDILPTLNLDDLRQDRQRLREETGRALKKVRESKMLPSDTLKAERDDDNDENKDSLPTPVSRERSMSAPQITDAKEGVQGRMDNCQAGLKSLLRKFDSAYFNNGQPRKSVQFRLPAKEKKLIFGDG